MRRTTKRLGALDISRLKKQPGLHADGGGLYLQVTKAGVPSWIFRYKAAGAAERSMGLGPLHTVSLAKAREKALECRGLRLNGIDPIEQRKMARAAALLEAVRTMTFKECAEAYINAHAPGWRNPKHAKQWPSSLETYAYPVLGNLSAQAVDLALVMRVLEPIWLKKPETANRVRGRIEAILDWAGTRGYRHGENPARWRGHLENLLPKRSKVAPVKHHAALAYRQIGNFMAELREIDGCAARALEFAILTCSRTNEALGARWEEFDLAGRIWTVPPERMKGGREHRVALSDPALAIVEEMAAIRQNQFVFPGQQPGRPLSNMAMLMLLRRQGGKLTVHGFRSTFTDWCSERTNFAAEVREMALAHAVGDKVEAAYRRGDLFEKRRQLAEAWARYCASPPAAGDVVPMRRAR